MKKQRLAARLQEEQYARAAAVQVTQTLSQAATCLFLALASELGQLDNPERLAFPMTPEMLEAAGEKWSLNLVMTNEEGGLAVTLEPTTPAEAGEGDSA